MAKISIEQLKRKYGFAPGEVKGRNYRTLIQDIIQSNTENIGKATARISGRHWETQSKKLKDKKRLILPDEVKEVLPKRSVFLRKAARDGNYLSDNLRDRLTSQLRETLNNYQTGTGKLAYVRRAGTMAGTINPKVIEQFQKKIKKTFMDYRRKDPASNVPANIKAIAVTEVRSTVNDVKEQYNRKLYEKNRDKIKMFVRWIQNKSLAKVPRKGHSEVNNKTIEFGQKFKVPAYDHKGRLLFVTEMRHPHDPDAPAEQVISCNCDAEYYIETI